MFELPKLKYSYDALEPFIDAKTMEIHHSKHHQTYVDKLNEVLAKYPNFSTKSLEEMLGDLSIVPEDIRTAVKNHGGGHWNHSFFWQILTDQRRLDADSSGNLQGNDLLKVIENQFVSFDSFKEQFIKIALGHFGSGWAWLSKDKDDKLMIHSTANQDCPLSQGLKPILGVDLWEHAYYLKYQNRRVEYLENWWQVVNWEKVVKNYETN